MPPGCAAAILELAEAGKRDVDRGEPGPLVALADVYLRRARRLCERALDADPTSESAWRLLARLE